MSPGKVTWTLLVDHARARPLKRIGTVGSRRMTGYGSPNMESTLFEYPRVSSHWHFLPFEPYDRLQIGYYHLCGVDPSVLRNTDFRDCHSVFCGAWARIVRVLETAHEYGIGVLIGKPLSTYIFVASHVRTCKQQISMQPQGNRTKIHILVPPFRQVSSPLASISTTQSTS